MRRSTLLGVLLLTIVAIALPRPAGAETRIALVIGNSDYLSNPLGSPKNDAKAIEAKLKVLSFHVTRKTDLGREEFFDAIRDFAERLQQPGTVGLFYYSGHGMQVNNRNYMIPIDANIRSEVDVERYAVPVQDVLARMESGKSNPNFVILDACRNNPFEKRFKSSQDGLAPMDAPASTLIVFAAASGRVAKAETGGNLSPYTEALAEHIDQPYPDSISMFQAVHKAVSERSGGDQRPSLELQPDLGKFSFKPLNIKQLIQQSRLQLHEAFQVAQSEDEHRQVKEYQEELSRLLDERHQVAQSEDERRQIKEYRDILGGPPQGPSSWDVSLFDLPAWKDMSPDARAMLSYEFGPLATQGWEDMPQAAKDDLVRQMALQRESRLSTRFDEMMNTVNTMLQTIREQTAADHRAQ